MSITKQYVELMGGTITVQSKKGSGSSFTVELPMELTDVEKVRKQEPPVAKADLTGVRILLAEDNDLNAEIAEVQLKECGMQVTRVADGQEAVDAFTSHPTGTFDIILMDIMMPNMDGYKATQTIRKLSDLKKVGITIVAMTANAFDEDKQNAYKAGMNWHIAKPIKVDELMSALTEILKEQRKTREIL